MAATCFAIEGATGDMSRTLQPAFEAYGDRPGVDMSSPRTTRWLRNHAKYDDEHPKIALEIVSRITNTEVERVRVMHAAKRSLELLHQALLTSTLAYHQPNMRAANSTERRGIDRRLSMVPIPFPERRTGDRRAHMERRAG
jgi:pyrroloquinoline quinone (PQQ) biosynthesis protein C